MYTNTQTKSIINTYYLRKCKDPPSFSLISDLLPFSSLRRYRIWRLTLLVTSFRFLIKQYLYIKHKETAWKFHSGGYYFTVASISSVNHIQIILDPASIPAHSFSLTECYLLCSMWPSARGIKTIQNKLNINKILGHILYCKRNKVKKKKQSIQCFPVSRLDKKIWNSNPGKLTVSSFQKD